MTSTIDDTVEETMTPPQNRRLRQVLVAVIMAAVIGIGVAAGYAWGNGNTPSTSMPSDTSVDVGFAQDMVTHHSQAVTMASYTRDNTDSPAIKVLAYDIESEQTFQIGQMNGWFDSWGSPRINPSPMAWMAGHGHVGTNGLMPGMATPDQISKLETLHGTALDIFFLQLMIHHHQGGVPMAQYAAQHATQSYVRTLAQAIVVAQSSEIVSMEQLLRQLGGSPLPPPAS